MKFMGGCTPVKWYMEKNCARTALRSLTVWFVDQQPSWQMKHFFFQRGAKSRLLSFPLKCWLPLLFLLSPQNPRPNPPVPMGPRYEVSEMSNQYNQVGWREDENYEDRDNNDYSRY